MSKKSSPWLYGTHHCQITTDSQSCLPKLPPQAGTLRRCARSIRKKLMVSRKNIRTRILCRSEASTKAERHRHLQSSWFVIHPFSEFSIVREIIMSIVWMTMYITEPIIEAFPADITPMLIYLTVFIDVILFLNCITCFVLGYYISKTKEVVLDPKKIVKHYLKTYFIVDLATAVPCSTIVSKLLDLDNYRTLAFIGTTKALGFFRIGTTLMYSRQLTLLFKISDTTHDAICLVIMSLFFFHWLACVTYLVPSVSYFLYGTVDQDSWTVSAKMQPDKTDFTLNRVYTESLLMALCHLLAAGHGMHTTNAVDEITLFSIIYILGMIYTAYMIVTVFEMVRSARASENKYEEIMYQLSMYMVNKELPQELRTRLLLYYKHRFQMRYFREASILSTLSEHQRSELFLYSCKELIDNAKLFQGIPKTVVGLILASLRHEVYLTDDVILKAGTTGECMFFIDKGTVAEVLSSGKEVRHLEDSEHFGEMPLILKEMNGVGIVSYIATEITECFRLEKRDLKHCMSLFDEFAERLTKQAKDRYDLLLQMEEDEDFIINRKDVLYDLRSGKILERPRRRLAIEK